MDDATQFPEPMDENLSEHLADSTASHLTDSAAGQFADGFAGQLGDSVPQSQAAEPEGTIEIEWEAEVDAFVKAETDAAAGDAVTGQMTGEPTEAAASIESNTGNSESADVALGFESACHCFAGSIGATEEHELKVSSSEENRPTEAAPQEEILLLPEEEPSPSVASEALASAAMPREDRRKRRRAMISAPVRVRGVNVTNHGPDEVSTTIDVSRNGILFVAAANGYYKGMDVAVMFPYSGSPTAIHAEQCGRVVRAETLADGRMVVALALGVGVGEDLVDACGNKLASGLGVARVAATGPELEKPLVLAMDPDAHVRVSVKTYLESEGYKVIAVGNVVDACHVLDILQPALVVAEIEGDGLPGAGMPGYDLCVHIKETQRLKRIPVVLTTRSAYPSDYSNAHALGAIVCMAKPYKQERLGHIVRLLAPLQAHKEASGTTGCRPDPKRKACATPHAGAGRAPLPQKKYDENTSLRRKSRFPSFG